MMVLCCGSLLCLASGISLADDLFPFAFRGLPGSVFAEFDFATDGSSPTQFSKVDLPGATFSVLDPTFVPQDLTYSTGGWTAAGGVGIAGFLIPNFIDFEPYKAIQVQLTFRTTLAGPPSIFSIIGTDNIVGEVAGSPVLVEDVSDVFRIETWVIQPNPDYETIQILVPPGTFLDQVVIDTISIPESSSLLLVGLGTMLMGGVIRRRRRVH
jgi:hypothetical protein